MRTGFANLNRMLDILDRESYSRGIADHTTPIGRTRPHMYDYRLFYPQMSIDDQARTRRPLNGHAAQRVYQLPAERRTVRNGGRR
jgi:hypothetical protein